MPKWLLAAALAFSSISEAKADGIQIARGSNGALVLRAESCEVLTRQAEAICSWRAKATGQTQSSSSFSCKRAQKGQFELKVLECLPELARNFHQKKLYRSGPNCWGTAMSFNGLFSRPRFMWSEEMRYWLESPLCRKLAPGEEKRPGDVINVFGPEYVLSGVKTPLEGKEFLAALTSGRLGSVESDRPAGPTGYQTLMHSVIYLTPELAFGKDSPRFDDSFYFHPLAEVYGRPRAANPACQENQELVPYLNDGAREPQYFRSSEGCSYFSNAYRCEDIQGYFAKQSLTSEEEQVLGEIREIQKLQEKLFPLVTEAKAQVSEEEELRIRTIAQAARTRTLEEISRGSKGDPTYSLREMLLVSEYFSASGLIKSLEQARSSVR